MISRQFILAGRAIFTLDIPASFTAQHPEVKSHYTFKVKRSEPKGKWPEAWWVSLLTGPDNEADYQPIGKVNPDTGVVTITRNSKYGDDTWPVRLLRRVLHAVWYPYVMPELPPASSPENPEPMAKLVKSGFVLHHEGRCGRCGRTLTVPESITSGFGPECISLVMKGNQQ